MCMTSSHHHIKTEVEMTKERKTKNAKRSKELCVLCLCVAHCECVQYVWYVESSLPSDMCCIIHCDSSASRYFIHCECILLIFFFFISFVEALLVVCANEWNVRSSVCVHTRDRKCHKRYAVAVVRQRQTHSTSICKHLKWFNII